MGKRIMVVDDSRMVHLQMKRILEGSGYDVVACCQDGESAIDMYAETKPDLVTMDIIMPGVDGLEAARAILEDDPKAKIIMVSSLAYDETLNEAKEIGALGFIYKPFEPDQVRKVLDAIFASGR